MSSSHVLIGRGADRGTSATLESGRLRILRGPEVTLIPLAAVREVRAWGESLVEILLTDGAVHQVSGSNPTATAAFTAALNRALPQERDPAGSALVTIESGSGGEPLWRGDDAQVSLGTDRLRVVRGIRSTDIPLVAVREARVEGRGLLQVVLTDGATHQLPGGRPDATAAFAATVNAALPPERERHPGGSELATTVPAPGGKPPGTSRRPLVGSGAVVLAYLCWTIWAGVTHGSFAAVSVTIIAVPFFLGLAVLAATGFGLSVRAAMSRRGITVLAVRASDEQGHSSPRFEFTAMDGVTYAHHTRRHATPTLHVVHDSLRPYRTIVPGSPVTVVLKYTVTLACACALLALSAYMTYEVFA
ncbi:hypothetical protein [Streptomyces sp. TBY4]|uniref:hypothetical protein n=1 Tax=Streptomyces sp. TBY4 TaxID=2962030 RepID=UPI0020B8C3B3|nr:hypothetical protein [Streptomyces sp. TBY4]MCP3760475.1 hypothetical protein [Streptomyces sp. TBY4]